MPAVPFHVQFIRIRIQPYGRIHRFQVYCAKTYHPVTVRFGVACSVVDRPGGGLMMATLLHLSFVREFRLRFINEEFAANAASSVRFLVALLLVPFRYRHNCSAWFACAVHHMPSIRQKRFDCTSTPPFQTVDERYTSLTLVHLRTNRIISFKSLHGVVTPCIASNSENSFGTKWSQFAINPC